MERDILRAVIDPIVLNLVSKRAMYGYEIVKEANERSNGVFELKEGTLYPCLHRLEANGLVEGKWEIPVEGRKRKYYHITGHGQEILTQSAARWDTLSGAVNALLTCTA